ncbi:MAG: 2-dehydropantoate 2-reductase, partial [Chloroflexi bacterium]|nr:2-dehydropantoate 2-reductase [Chloroflexota bacterium]
MKYRFLVFGAGAIGTYLGASLARQDHKVVFLERAADIQTLREQGLRVELEGEVLRISEPRLINNLDEIQEGAFDLAIMALKTYHLENILPDLIRLKDQFPPLLCLQNGVESEKVLVNALGVDKVLSGTVTSAVDRLSKGNVIVQKLRGMGLGGPHSLASELVPIFKQAGLNCSYFPQAEQMKWSKLVTNLLGNASSAILDLPPSQIYKHPGLYQMELDQIRETLE